MEPLATVLNREARSTAATLNEYLDANRRDTDRMFAWLVAIQWVAGIITVFWISPRAWRGEYSYTHLHVWAAIFLGGIISGFPLLLVLTKPGAVLTRHVVAVGQMMSCGLLIHLMGGRIEAHFQYFGALAFLAFYRDWRVLVTASLVAAADHLIRGYYWPLSIFGVAYASPWRAAEHISWILFEDIFLMLAIRQNLWEMTAMAEKQARVAKLEASEERAIALKETNEALQNEIAERKRSEESLRMLTSAVEQAKDSIVVTDADIDSPGPRILFVNPAFTEMTGYTAEEVIGKTPRILQGPLTDREVLTRLRNELAQGRAFEGEAINYRKDGSMFTLQWQAAPVRDTNGNVTHFVAIQRDITEEKRMEAHLFQSQKMETVGKLAGGVAHEFNSILTAIIGQSEFLVGELPPGEPLSKSAEEIHKAADRAATLTRQLLAYGRKQILQPKVLDPNALVGAMIGTLRHLVGRAVEVDLVLGTGLKTVKIDPGQMEQVIVSIAMNAAEAMPNGGRLTLETANVVLESEYVRAYPGLKPGPYVMLAISDTGMGMTEEIRARAFEPFFSTKGVGEGSGLGLATCYGIVKQSDGHIGIYSEPARGTTVKVYLPQVHEGIKAASRKSMPLRLPMGAETILLAEDDPALLQMASDLLRRLGYKVLTATDGVEALNLKHQRDIGHIDLLLTDVVMPHMSGKELADRIRAIYPLTKILFTSAFTESAIVHQGVLKEGLTLLQKPFTPSTLARKVREVLDQPLHP